jgi:hypothetical protein
MLDSMLRLAVILLSASLLSWCAGCGHSPAAASKVQDLDGRHFELWAGEPSAATVVVFTRHDCPISNRFAPTVKNLYEKYNPQGVRFFLAYVDPKETADHIRQHLQEFDYPCPALRDPAHALVAATGATVTPEAVVYGRDQNIVYRGRIDDLYSEYGKSRDAATTHELADAIESALAGNTSPLPFTTAVGCPIADLK